MTKLSIRMDILKIYQKDGRSENLLKDGNYQSSIRMDVRNLLDGWKIVKSSRRMENLPEGWKIITSY